MTTVPRIASLLLLLASGASACAVTVVEEGAGGAGGTGTGTSVTGTSVTSTATGTGGVSTTTATGTGGVSTTTATGTGGTTTATSTGVGGSSGACTDAADLAIINSTDVFASVVVCGMMFIGQDPQQLMCILAKTGLSYGCGGCYDVNAECIIQNCLNMCISNQTGPACTQCRATKCDPSFMLCSGLSHGP